MAKEPLLLPRPEGLYCPAGDFFIDPLRPVPRALITHGHSDHARSGHEKVLATKETLDIMAIRYGGDFAGSMQVARHGEVFDLDGVTAHFFADQPRVKADWICSIGYGDPSTIFDRSPRPEFGTFTRFA